MEWVSTIVLVGSSLLVVSILTSYAAMRIGTPLLLIFLAVGLVAGPDGIGGISFNNPDAAFLIGSVALAVILFESGLDTRVSSYRLAAWPALTLATLGVAVTTLMVGGATHVMLGLGWLESLLVGSVVSSTDAAAVFFLLRVGGITIRDRVRSTLEIESGSNDPMAILVTVLLVEALAANSHATAGGLALEFIGQIGGGVMAGLLGGALLVAAINATRMETGLDTVVSMAMALFIFGVTGVLGGSGFLAVYIAGLVAGNAPLRGAIGLRRFHSGLAWLSQIVMFVTLGLLANPRSFGSLLLPAVGIATVLMFVARPLAVWLCLWPYRFSTRETTFIAWVGLRGAVSILLALLPMMGHLPGGPQIFNTAILVVIASLALQGWTIGPVARRLGLIVPPRTGQVERVELELPGGIEHELVVYRVHARSTAARLVRLPRWARAALVIRDGRVVPSHKARPLMPGDHVYVFTAPSRLRLLDTLFSGARASDQDERDLFGDLALHAEATVGQIAGIYGLPVSAANAGLRLRDLFDQEFAGACELGDRLRLGEVELIVRDMDDGAVTSVGLALEPAPPRQARLLPFLRSKGTVRAMLAAAIKGVRARLRRSPAGAAPPPPAPRFNRKSE
jgi:cell volume regulation protein A